MSGKTTFLTADATAWVAPHATMINPPKLADQTIANGDIDHARGDHPTIETGTTETSAPQRRLSGQRKTVLIVDDEPSVRLLIREVLDDLDYISFEAIDGASGLNILRSDAPIDLLIADVGLPGGMDGRGLASAARAARPGLAILFITGYADPAALGNEALKPGMMLLSKPFSIEALASHIRALTP